MLNSEMLLLALNDVPDDRLERTRRSLGYQITERKTKRPRLAWRTLLIAAVIATLMVGTAYAAGWISLDSLRVGRAYGVRVISMEGLKDSSEGRALAEWLAYYDVHKYDDFDPTEAFELMDEYGCYGVTTREMADKVDEICEKYGLEKLGKMSAPPDERSYWKAAGVGKLTRGSAEYENDYLAGYVYPGGTFQYDGAIFPTGEKTSILYQLRRSVKGSFGYVVGNAAAFDGGEEWAYRTKSGQDMTLINANSAALMLLDLKDSFVTVSLSKAGYYDAFNDGYIDGIGDGWTSLEITNEQLESMAETFRWEALSDPDAGMDEPFTYHEYAPRKSAEELVEVDVDLSQVKEPYQYYIRLAYRDTIEPFIRDFELVDYGAEHLPNSVGGWITFKGTPKTALNWKRIPTEDGELFCRAFNVVNDNGSWSAGESFDALPYQPLSWLEFVTVNGEEKENWLGTEIGEITSATLHVQQTGVDYTLTDGKDLADLRRMLRYSEVAGGTDCMDWNPLYLTFADGRRALAFTAADGSDSVRIFGGSQHYQYGRTIFDLFGVPLEAAGYTRHEGLLTYREDFNGDGLMRLWEEVDYSEGGEKLARRVMSDKLRESRFEYDGKGNLIRESWWEGDTVTLTFTYTYDDAGRLIGKESQGVTGWEKTTYEYDAQGRLAAELHTDNDDLPGFTGGNIYYSYDENGICTRRMGWQS
ncbi:MAG: hypothetical protein IJV41_04940 [Oscillospiraceae bacterium]|nr:hypothetical protein [Oscillospiraceae bacterium]